MGRCFCNRDVSNKLIQYVADMQSQIVPKLKDAGLFREQAYVGGQWLDAKTGSKFDVIGGSSCPMFRDHT